MATGLLLQPEFIVSYLKAADDPTYKRLQQLLAKDDNDYYPTMSVVSYGMTRESIMASTKLDERGKRDMETRLRSLRRDLNKYGCFFEFDKDAADEWAVLRRSCTTGGIKLDAERQIEYAIALAKNQAILAPARKKATYPAYPSVVIERL